MDADILKSISVEVNRLLGCQTEVHKLVDSLSFAFNPDRGQYHSTLILEMLEKLAPSGSIKVLAVADVDLFIPILTYVYGEAQLGGRSCIISTHRLNEGISIVGNQAVYHCRIVKEAIHELGHTFNLRHCKDPACIMHYCRSIKDVDKKSDQLCRYCKVLLDDEVKRMSRKKR